MTAGRALIYSTARPEYVTVQAFGQHFGISKMHAYRLLHSGAVRWIRIGNLMRIPVSELARFAKDAEHAAASEVWELTGEEEA